MSTRLFPLGIAKGQAFCNRNNERKLLTTNIGECRHTLITSPRRYGKTSLILQVTSKNKTPFTRIDFLLAGNEQNVEELVLSGIEKLTAELMPSYKKALTTVTKLMSSLKPEIAINKDGVKIKLFPGNTPKQSIVEALVALDKIATAEKKQIVIAMNEFQQISTLKNSNIIEAAIRHAAEQASFVSYIFSGSNRRMLLQMFDDNTRPLYNLCERLTLERISAQHYDTFLQKAAQKTWHKELNDASINIIFELTKRHPYYINVLCSRAWRKDTMPTARTIEEIWKNYCDEERHHIAGELAALSPNQRIIVASLAKHPSKHTSGQEFLTITKLSAASNSQALQTLYDKDIIFRDENGLVRPLNPVVEYTS